MIFNGMHNRKIRIILYRYALYTCGAGSSGFVFSFHINQLLNMGVSGHPNFEGSKVRSDVADCNCAPRKSKSDDGLPYIKS